MEVIIFIAAGSVVTFFINSYFSKPKYDQEYYDALESIKIFNKHIEAYKKEYFTYDYKTTLTSKFQETYKYFSKRTFRKTK